MSKDQQKKHIIDMMEKDQELGLYEESKYPLCDCERPDYFCDCLLYDEKIKEESKQEIKLEDVFNDEKRQCVKDLIDAHKQDDENYLDSFGVTKTQFEVYRNFNKQETLEEAVNNFKKTDVYINEIKQEQDKNKYSEEEVLDLLNRREDYMNSEGDIFNYQSTKQWFEQFKKK
jgi:hypothetical protein